MLTAKCLFSGSKGNSILISNETDCFLIDAGVSMRALTSALSLCGTSPEKLTGVYVTHEHSDHVKALGQLSLRFHVPVFATNPVAKQIYASLLPRPNEAEAFASCVNTIRETAHYENHGIYISPFLTPHDSAKSVGFVIGDDTSEKLIAVATDMGFAADTVENALIGCRSVILESNHDIELLVNSNYPDFLKQRIMSDFGHMSNDSCAAFAKLLVGTGTKNIILFHLSEENNTPDLAFFTTYDGLIEDGVREDDGITLAVASKSCLESGLAYTGAKVGVL